MGECGLYLGKRVLGRLTWESNGTRLRLHADCPCELGWIYRVVLQTETGELPLGVMLPEQERFTLRREIPAEHLPLCAFIDRTLPGEVHLPGLPLAFSAFSESESLELGEAIDTFKSAWWRETQYFLFPLEPEAPCGLAHYLSLTTLLEHEGVLYGVFCREDGIFKPITDRLRTS